MATETEKTTRELVEELFDAGTTEADAIAEKLGKSKGTVYVHIRNIQKERGIKPRGRGRPPKANKDGETKPASKPAGKAARPAPTRKAPGTAKATTEQKSATPTKANGNGHVSGAERFPLVAEAIERQISEKQKELGVLENMLAGLTK